MSDDDGDLDIESEAEKRAHHNALERKRRDHIKDSFNLLRDAVPNLQGEKASRAQILNKATEYIQFMRRKNNSHQNDIEDLKKQNMLLDQQIRLLEKTGADPHLVDNGLALLTSKGGTVSAFDGGSGSDSDSDEDPSSHGRRKRLKTSSTEASGSTSTSSGPSSSKSSTIIITTNKT